MTYDASRTWGGPIKANRPRIPKTCCICGKRIVHGEQYDAAHGLPMAYAHTACRAEKEKAT